ncbi:MAG: sigma-54 dependent transcriptional regulator [Gemmatimonadota bacterium]|jgi:two-component system response regulator PilR (NtrC family)|nr:hypothetical protein [Gemmatimonadota bacterium]MDP6461394.1 sigma-54 dependent transcriptional regulator [Gemmatimonadota bacterium]MDP6530158.1 sigma-54 dependent transcriptional regulator [Gemmatimonadota bacterium]MDP6802999.1 sigma-54 dependent transcriptional regulator [Gemmatimonadota bacterium]MDP7032576.1 sigma-54 dependent transcriptional regulator [Gemmatimonadota bacterium]
MTQAGNGTDILLIEPEESTRRHLRRLLGAGRTLHEASSGEEGLEVFGETAPDLVVMEVRLPDRSGLEVLKAIRKMDRCVPCVVLSREADPRAVVRALGCGANDYLSKADGWAEEIPESVKGLLKAARESRRSEPLPSPAPVPECVEAMVGESAAMMVLREKIARIAAAPVNVVVRGESGSGKELVARQVHALSARRDGNFVDLLIPGLPETLLMDELFGHEKGSFTNGDSERIGHVEAADGGTLMLDEIAELPNDAQVALLRVLQEKTFRRIGGDARKVRRSDFRVISVTQEDLRDLCERGAFRRDLHFRLRQVEIVVPPLRERLDDVPILAEHFLLRHRGWLGDWARGFTPGAIRKLSEWEYRENNVRELENLVIELICRGEGHKVEASVVSLALDERQGAALGCADFTLPDGWMGLSYHEASGHVQDAFQRRYLEHALHRSHGVVKEAARLADIPRQSFSRMLSRHGMSRRKRKG